MVSGMGRHTQRPPLRVDTEMDTTMATQVCAMLVLMGAAHVLADEPSNPSTGLPAAPGAHHPSLFEQIVHLGAKHAPASPEPAPALHNPGWTGVDGDGEHDGLEGAVADAEEDVAGDTPAEKLVRPAVATAAHGKRHTRT